MGCHLLRVPGGGGESVKERPVSPVPAAAGSEVGAAPSGAGFLLDLARCVGCGACAVACRVENTLPARVSWRRILPLNLARNPFGPTYHFSLACHHCQSPPCARACPTGALEKRPDGVVLLQEGRCIGCRYCEMACPFGAPAFDEVAGVMTKCHLCHTRLDQGLLPACVVACPTHALRFAHEVDRAPQPFVAAPVVPGFADPSDARPSLRLAPPRGSLRARALKALEELLNEEGGRDG